MLPGLLEKTWWAKRPTLLARLLKPLSWLYGLIVRARADLYRRGMFKRTHPGVAVVVVGNVVVGGAGKTPVVQAIVRCLQKAGYRPGVISRGYPVSPKQPRAVTVRSTAADVGDEPMLHFNLGVPVVVCADRALAAVHLLAQHPDVNVLVADDDGVCVVPAKQAPEVAQKGQKRQADETAKRDKLASGILGLDMYKMREPLEKAGLTYLDDPEEV